MADCPGRGGPVPGDGELDVWITTTAASGRAAIARTRDADRDPFADR